MRRVKNKSIRTKILNIKVQAFSILLLLVAVLLTGYVTLLGLSIKNVIVRKEAEVKMANLQAEVSKMEREYIMRVSDISRDRASGVGLTKIVSKSFAERRVLVGQAY